jgi:CRP-like cAMP-binding protein
VTRITAAQTRFGYIQIMSEMATGGITVPDIRSAVLVSRGLESGKKFPVHSLKVDDPPLGLSTNRILAVLPAEEVKFLPRALERITFGSNDVVFRPGATARYVYFPEGAVISLLASMEDGRSVEVSVTGAEGILGVHEILGGSSYRYSGLVEIAGPCLRMEMEPFKAEFGRGGMLHARTLRYLRYLLVQVSQMAACNRLHRVKQRLARRLLMIQDRVRKSEFPMTHEALACALGTPRSEVSFAAEALRRFRIIDYERGQVTVLSRKKLESMSCECYGVIHREFLGLG